MLFVWVVLGCVCVGGGEGLDGFTPQYAICLSRGSGLSAFIAALFRSIHLCRTQNVNTVVPQSDRVVVYQMPEENVTAFVAVHYI